MASRWRKAPYTQYHPYQQESSTLPTITQGNGWLIVDFFRVGTRWPDGLLQDLVDRS